MEHSCACGQGGPRRARSLALAASGVAATPHPLSCGKGSANSVKGREWRKLAFLSVASGIGSAGLFVGVLFLSGGQRALNILRVWESSDADANHEMVTFSEALAEKATVDSVLSDAKLYHQLHVA